MTYYFSQVQGGYRWNMINRIKETIGIEPISTCDVDVDEVKQTAIEFDRDLTKEEYVQLEAIMADDPAIAPESPTVFKIKDIYNHLDAFNKATGLNLSIYYSESVPGSGDVDMIELHADRVLTEAERDTVRDAYSALMQ